MTLFREELPTCCVPRWWHGRAYYCPMRGKNIMVIYPFHWLVNLAWWINHRWCRHKGKRSWIDRMRESQ